MTSLLLAVIVEVGRAGRSTQEAEAAVTPEDRNDGVPANNEHRRWPPTRRQVLATYAIVIALGSLSLLYYFRFGWPLSASQTAWVVALAAAFLIAVSTLIGIGYRKNWTGFGDKTLWSWLELLASISIPLVIAIGGFWFTENQNTNREAFEKRREDEQRNFEDQRTQDAALQRYFDQMAPFLTTSEPSDKERALATARTLAVLEELDEERRGRVLQFLYGSGLIAKGSPMVSLSGANLSGVSIDEGDLYETDLAGAVLSNANLSGTDLSGANLAGTRLDYAILLSANLRGADLTGDTLLHCATLRNVDLREAKLDSRTQLRLADLSHAKLSKLELQDVDFQSADLSFAILRDSVLAGATNLRGAYLIGANLSGADLSELEGPRRAPTQEQIELAEGISQEVDAERSTKLPYHLEVPVRWTNPQLVELQERRVEEEEARPADREARAEAREAHKEAREEASKARAKEALEEASKARAEAREAHKEAQEEASKAREEASKAREEASKVRAEASKARAEAREAHKEAYEERSQSCSEDRLPVTTRIGETPRGETNETKREPKS